MSQCHNVTMFTMFTIFNNFYLTMFNNVSNGLSPVSLFVCEHPSRAAETPQGLSDLNFELIFGFYQQTGILLKVQISI